MKHNHRLIDKITRLEKQIGNTPLRRFDRVFSKPGVSLFAKLEWDQLGGSVKARPAFNIIKQAVLSGELGYGQTLLDASSGNTGIAYAMIGKKLGIPVTIYLPENASPERIRLLKENDAKIVFTSPFGATDEAQEKAVELKLQRPDLYFYADQYANENNWKAHYLTTGPEIFAQTGGTITHFVAGLGTTGTFTGTGRRLKEISSDIRIVALHPDIGLHGLEGWKHMPTAKVPRIYEEELADENREVATEQAYDLMEDIYTREGLLVSPSSAANLLGAIRVAEQLESGTVVTIFPDNADKYAEVVDYVFDKEKYGNILN